MRTLKFRPQALFDLQIFIKHYEEAFFELYNDSGLWNEDWIIQSYRESAAKLHAEILSSIASKLDAKRVLGRKMLKGWQELDFHIGNRLVVVLFSDDFQEQIRWIEAIAIDRKPIIF